MVAGHDGALHNRIDRHRTLDSAFFEGIGDCTADFFLDGLGAMHKALVLGARGAIHLQCGFPIGAKTLMQPRIELQRRLFR